MSIPAATVFQIQSTATASNVNSGGFNPANANMITDGAATSATGNSPVFSSASYNFVAGDVGHWVYIKSGTNWTSGWYQVASVAANAATLSASVGQGIQVNNNLYGTQTVAGVATVSSPTGATWTMDYSQSNSSPFTGTDLTGATTTCTSASNPFGLQMVGNLIHLNSGTGVTAGWYEIQSVSVVTATLDRSAGATYSSVTYHTGGALSLGSSDDAVFALATSSATAAGRYFVKGSVTYTLNGTVTVSNGNAAWPVIIEGYSSTRGDRPTGSSAPTFAAAAAVFTTGSNNNLYSLRFTGTASSVVNSKQNNKIFGVYLRNTSTSASRSALLAQGQLFAFYVEAISYAGIGISMTTQGGEIMGSYCHDSDTGINVGVAGGYTYPIIDSIISGCITDGVKILGTASAYTLVANCTIYGAENKLGSGLNILTSGGNNLAVNNIFYGLANGVAAAPVGTTNFDDYNDYFNNTSDVNDVTKWQKGSHDISVDPQFTSVQQRTGATATSTSGNHLVQSGATFVTWGVTAGRDYVYVKSGTGVTGGIYGITSVDSETQITLDNTFTANATADKVWQITTGQNFSIGTNLKALGYPGTFPAGLTTGYIDIGAAQRQESSGGSGGSFTFS